MKKIDTLSNINCNKVAMSCMIILFILFILNGCSSPTSPKSSLTGTITIEGQTDYSNITVALYHIATLDTALVRINLKHPAIGLPISQQTEFDFREHTPVQITQTNSTGNFSISDVSEGRYNVVIYRNGFGFKIFYDYDIASGSYDLNLATVNGDIELYPETTLTGQIVESMTLLTDHHYIMNGNVNFLNGSSVTIQPGAYIRISPSTTLRFGGAINFQGLSTDLIHFTSNYGLVVRKGIPTAERSIEPYNEIIIDPTATVGTLEGCLFTYGKYGLTTSVACTLKNSIFHTSLASFKASQVENITIENCIFQNILNAVQNTQTAVEMDLIANLTAQKCIFYNNSVGFYIKRTDDGLIKNNYFHNNQDKAIRIEYQSYTDINHNTITGSYFGIFVYQYCDFELSYNLINSSICVETEGAFAIPVLFNNNFYCSATGYCVKYITLGSGPLNAINNYWSVDTSELISGKIYDKNDISPSQEFYSSYNFVNFTPFKLSAVNSAGVYIVPASR